VCATLAELPQLALAAGIGSPATIVVGDVVHLAQHLAWFTPPAPVAVTGSISAPAPAGAPAPARRGALSFTGQGTTDERR
jgi:hypothetical protein